MKKVKIKTILIEGNVFQHIPLQGSEENVFRIGDFAINGRHKDGDFWILAVYQGGDPESFDSWKARETIKGSIAEPLTVLQIPNKKEFIKYAQSKIPNIDPEEVGLRFELWKENNWHTGGEKPRKIENWKTTLLNTLPHLKKTTLKKTGKLNA